MRAEFERYNAVYMGAYNGNVATGIYAGGDVIPNFCPSCQTMISVIDVLLGTLPVRTCCRMRALHGSVGPSIVHEQIEATHVTKIIAKQPPVAPCVVSASLVFGN